MLHLCLINAMFCFQRKCVDEGGRVSGASQRETFQQQVYHVIVISSLYCVVFSTYALSIENHSIG